MLLANAGHAAPNLEKPPLSDPIRALSQLNLRVAATKATN